MGVIFVIFIIIYIRRRIRDLEKQIEQIKKEKRQ